MMATVANTKSTLVTLFEAGDQVPIHKLPNGMDCIIDTKEITAEQNTDVGDVLLFCPIPTNAVIINIATRHDDLDGGTALVVNGGLYYSGIGGDQALDGNTSGTVADDNCFFATTAFAQTASLVWLEMPTVGDPVDSLKEAWELAGLSADPGGHFYIGLEVTTPSNTPLAGGIAMKVEYIN